MCFLISSVAVSDRVIFLPGTFQNVSVSQNETVQAVVSRIPPEVTFITLQFHTQHRNATLSYTRVRTHDSAQSLANLHATLAFSSGYQDVTDHSACFLCVAAEQFFFPLYLATTAAGFCQMNKNTSVNSCCWAAASKHQKIIHHSMNITEITFQKITEQLVISADLSSPKNEYQNCAGIK